jgi:hypothetical protein
VFYNALGYAVEQGHLASNPVDRIQWTTPAVAASVDRRVVVSPAQARSLLAAVRALSGRGQPATEVARRAGYGAAVLFKIDRRIDGQANAANQRIADALGIPEAERDPGDEGNADSEPAA